ncbi:hypothetical protein [Prodigiosinella confusarubida]|uniref:hypothetical protein n=1 Tax=Serratia sp. (strain ATCC 39006) TaxID=104623 RepID=UPI000392335C|nr:hypothetical protein [Serratia sp. ATCC 39006]
MSESIKAYFNAAASVMNIMPSTNYMESIHCISDLDSIKHDVVNVAMDMRKVMEYERQKQQGAIAQSACE